MHTSRPSTKKEKNGEERHTPWRGKKGRMKERGGEGERRRSRAARKLDDSQEERQSRRPEVEGGDGGAKKG